MNNTSKISFIIDSTDASVTLGLECWLDDHKFFDTHHVQGARVVSVDVNDTDGDHSLRFVLKNKTAEHTRIDDNGNIVSDARLIIRDLAVEEIKLGHMVTELAVYSHDFNGSAPTTQTKFYGELGCNGVVELKFSTPIYLWLLDHM